MANIELRDYLATEGAAATLPLGGTNRIIVGQGVNDRIATLDDVLNPIRSVTERFAANGTWTKPAGAVMVAVRCVEGGFSGGSGGKAAADNPSEGGDGGRAGRMQSAMLLASALAASVTVTVGAGAVGAPGRTTNGGAVQGVAGGHSTFGTLVSSNFVPDNLPFSTIGGSGGNNAPGSMGAPGTASAQHQVQLPSGGGGGGGAGFGAAVGGVGGYVQGARSLGGVGGNGGVGASLTDVGLGRGGGGGGGGDVDGVGDGGAGGYPGGGGGGGGGRSGSGDSGAGGNGGGGMVEVTTFF